VADHLSVEIGTSTGAGLFVRIAQMDEAWHSVIKQVHRKSSGAYFSNRLLWKSLHQNLFMTRSVKDYANSQYENHFER
jgi:hypothetical protein